MKGNHAPGHIGGRLRAAALAAAGLGALVHVNSLGNGFALDDVHVVQRNDAIHRLADLPAALGAPYWPGELGEALGLWRPLTTGVFGLLWAAGGGSPLPFHAANVLLHAAVSAAVVLLVGRLAPAGAAAVAGLVFAVHPVHVEAVANVVGLAELLSALLFLLACLVWMGGSVRPGEMEGDLTERPGRPFAVPGPGRLAVVVLLFAGATLAKEGAIVLPAVLVLLDATRRPIPVGGLLPWLRPRAGALALLGVAAAWVLSARYGVLGSVADPLPPPGASLLLEVPRIWTVAGVWPEYFRLLFFPLRLSSDYAPLLVPVSTVWTPRSVLGALLVLATLVAALGLWRRSLGRGPEGRVLPFGVVWFVLTVAPVSNLVFLAGVLLAERTLYLPSVGFAAAAGWALHRLVLAAPPRGRLVVAGVLVLLSVRTLERNPVWASTETVTARLIVDHPQGGRAQWALGVLHEENGRTREAAAAWALALGRMNRDHALLVDVGRRLMNQGRDRAALFLLGEAHRQAPASGNAVELIAVIHARAGDLREAERWARLATVLQPGSVASWHLLANALEQRGAYPEAARVREEVIRRGQAEHWQQWLSLARLRLRAGNGDGAAAALDSARTRAGPDVLPLLDSLLGTP